MGSLTLTTREAASALIARSKVYVDLKESVRNEAGGLMIPIEEGAVRPDHVRGEIGRVVTGELTGCSGPEEITLYKSLGIAAQDLYAAATWGALEELTPLRYWTVVPAAALGAVIGATTGVFGFLQTPGFPSIAMAVVAALAWYLGFRVLAWRRRTRFLRDELEPLTRQVGTA